MNSPHRLSKITLLLTSALYAQYGHAEILPATDGTQVHRQNNVEIVNIAAPTAAGLSHNQYQRYNVDKAGAVLNNALEQGRSVLAGDLTANPQLQQQAAKVILNEVVSKDPSTLAGQQEVFGKPADYVLANPNGITCDGCGFINTPRASLVVGKPEISQDQLTGYQVNGDHVLKTQGQVEAPDRLDLIAPTVDIQGTLHAKGEVDIISGRQQISRQPDGELRIQTVHQTGEVLDGKVAGSIQAGRIRIHSTDDRATLQVEGASLAAQDKLHIEAGHARIKGQIQTTDNESRHEKIEDKRVKLISTQKETQQDYRASQLKAKDITLQAKHTLNTAGASVEADKIDVRAAEIALATDKTTHSKLEQNTRTKGLWKRDELDSQSDETLHRTRLSGRTVQISATERTLTGEAVQIEADDIGLYGKAGVHLKGGREHKHDLASATFKNETARLINGEAKQSSALQAYRASELSSKNRLQIEGKDVRLSGVVGKVDGDLLVKSGQHAVFDAERTENHVHTKDDKTFWGGLAGAKKLDSNGNHFEQNGADFTVKGSAYIEAEEGVHISGSRVLAGKDAVVQAHKGGLVIDDVAVETLKKDFNRQGTVFNITKARNETHSHRTQSQQSTLSSQSNLRLLSDKTIHLVGSAVNAEGVLDIHAKDKVNVAGSQHRESYTHSNFRLGGKGKLDIPKISVNKDKVAAFVADTAQQLTNGTVTAKDIAQKALVAAKDAISAKVGGEAQLNAVWHQEQTEAVTHQHASLKGGTVKLQADTVKLGAAQVDAQQNITIDAQETRLVAQQDSVSQRSKDTELVIGNRLDATLKNLDDTLTVGVNHRDTQRQDSLAQTANLRAGEEVSVSGKAFSSEGGQLAAKRITEKADKVEHLAAHNAQSTHQRHVNVGLSVKAGLDATKALNTESKLEASGGYEKQADVKAVATRLNADNIHVTAQQLHDEGTQYKAKGDVSLTAQDHQLGAAKVQHTQDKLDAGATVNVTASTADFVTVKVSGGVDGKLKKASQTTTQDQNARIEANNIALTAKDLTAQADLSAVNQLNVSADRATFRQSEKHETHQSGGFEAGVTVGAIVVPSASVAVPSIAVKAKAEGGKGDSTQHLDTTLAAQTVKVTAQEDLSLQSTSVKAAQDAVLSGKRVSVSGGTDKARDLSIKAGASIGIGAAVSSTDLGVNLGVSHLDEASQAAATLQAKQLTINAVEAASVQAVQTAGEKLNVKVTQGDLNALASDNHRRKTAVDAELALKGNVAGGHWIPTSGSGGLGVEVVRNQTHTENQLQAKEAAFHVAGDARLSGTAVNAENIDSHIQGNTRVENTDHRIHEASFKAAASGGGKPVALTKENWVKQLQDDWNKGTLAGVSAKANFALKTKQEHRTVQSGWNPKESVVQKQTHLDVSADLPTNPKALYEAVNDAVKNGKFPWTVK